MSQSLKHWNSKALILLGTWLWEKGEYGHALLCMHAPHWGFKIGTQLSVSWNDVISQEDRKCYVELNLPDRNLYGRPINISLAPNIEKAFHELDIVSMDDSIYMNYKTGKPLTSSTLNRELQRFSEKFLKEIKETIGIDFGFKPLKTNAFEIAWALDMVNKYHRSQAVFKLVSTAMGHRTVKDTIELLEVEPVVIAEPEYNLIKGIQGMKDTEILDDTEKLRKYILREIIYENEEFIPIS